MKKYNSILALLCLLLIVLLSLKTCVTQRKYEDEVDKRKLSEQKFEKERDKNGQLIVKQIVLETSNRDLIDSITKGFNYKPKKVKSAILITSKLEIDTVYIPYHDSFFFYKDSFKHSRKFAYKDDCFSIDGSVDTLGVTINKIESLDSLLIIEKTKGFLVKKTELVIVSKNKCKDVTNVKSVKIKKRPSRLLRVIEGVLIFAVGYKMGDLL